MKTYEIMKCRRQAVGLNRQELAEKANLDVKLVEFYEDGKNVAGYVENRIKTVLMQEFQNMDSMTHYKRRILELALELNIQEETKWALHEIGHMMTELGKLQMEIAQSGKI